MRSVFFILFLAFLILIPQTAFAALPPTFILPICQVEAKIISSSEKDNIYFVFVVDVLDSNSIYPIEDKSSNTCKNQFIKGNKLTFSISKRPVDEFIKQGYTIESGAIIRFSMQRMVDEILQEEYWHVDTIFEYPNIYQLLENKRQKQQLELNWWKKFLININNFVNNNCLGCSIDLGGVDRETPYYKDQENKIRFKLSYGLNELENAQKRYNIDKSVEFIDKAHYQKYYKSLIEKDPNSYAKTLIMAYLVGGTEPDNSWIDEDEYYKMEFDRTIKSNRDELIYVYKRYTRFEAYEIFKYPISNTKAAYFIVATDHFKGKNYVYNDQIEIIKSVVKY